MRENIMIEYNFSAAFYMTVVKIFKGNEDGVNPGEFVTESFIYDQPGIKLRIKEKF